MTTTNTIEMIPLSKLRGTSANPRKHFDEAAINGLALSIREDGLLQNFVAAKPEQGKRKYDLISGERRLRAMKKLVEQGDLPKDLCVPVEVREGLSGEDALRLSTIENVQRENLTPLEEAQAIDVLAGGGERIEEITSKTGLSATTVKRRLALLNLSENAKAALSEGDISVSQAEALSIGTHEDQDEVLPNIINGWFSSPSEIRERLIDDAPALSDAIFDKEDYSGTFTSDLFSEDETTYFDDSEQFYALQKQAAEKLVQTHERENDWAELVEGPFDRWAYREAGKGESGGVVVHLSEDGKVEVLKGLVAKSIDASVTEACGAKPKPFYARSVIEYVAMQKSMALLAELLKNPRKAKEIAAAHRLRFIGHRMHGCLAYLERLGETSPALDAVNAECRAVLDILLPDGDHESWHGLMRAAYTVEQAYDLVQPLSDADLERVSVLLGILEFGQAECDRLDCDEASLFNRVANDIGADMRRWWKPDVWFLSRRTLEQLGTILRDSGLSRLYGNGKGYKKADLVPMMARYFTKVRIMTKPKAD